MIKKIVAIFAGVAVFVCILAFLPAYSQEDILVLEDDAFEDRQRPPAVFKHEGHNEKAGIDECYVCHHLYKNGKKVEDESTEDMSCSECHSVKGKDETRPLMKAYHNMCKECHISKKVGPITCGECHPR
ncbi:MAG: cytochrome c3 family protein [Desulfobacterales bacterium]|nr:cytochrome c3 family protein [Desulfobacterales bacterium]